MNKRRRKWTQNKSKILINKNDHIRANFRAKIMIKNIKEIQTKILQNFAAIFSNQKQYKDFSFKRKTLTWSSQNTQTLKRANQRAKTLA